MRALTETSLTPTERRVIDRFIGAVQESLGERLRSVWLYGSRARGEAPGPDSDVDLLIISDGGSKGDRPIVDEVVWNVASSEDANPFAFSTIVWDPAWLARRREIRSFFVQEVDRDKVVLFGEP